MKTPFHIRLICCWLALVVLLSSTGFGMIDHWCQMRGHTKSLLLTKDECATPCQSVEAIGPISTENTVKKMPCCKTQLSYEHLDVSRFVADQHSPAAPQPAEFIPNPAFRLLLAAIQPTGAVTAISTDDHLFRTGRYRLTSLCTWLI
ncbi:hypothetical protein [Spirosoma spitsbergense]|uniref:hypothetical protein n=1 Tax=Spirosoma spitsbergense TaxID=431554 RepID=UPI00036FEDC2|nr:hypothetical protein [Spirosoma spitsbergense]